MGWRELLKAAVSWRSKCDDGGGVSEMENTHVVARIISYTPLAQLWVELAAGGNEMPGK